MNCHSIKDTTRETEFKQKLQALLEEYGVEMEVKCKPVTGYYGYSAAYVNFYSYKFENVGTHYVDSIIDFTAEEGTYGPEFSKF